MVLQHDRTLYHVGTEDTTTATLSAPIGRYAQGATVQAVIEDMAARLAFIEGVGCSVVIKSFSLDAYIFRSFSLTLDAVISRPFKFLTLDASIHATVARSLTMAGYLIDHVGGQTTLVGTITSGTSPITVSGSTTFPTATPFVIVIDSEQMLVTAGGGSGTWTVTRGYNGTTAAAHTSGAAISEVC